MGVPIRSQRDQQRNPGVGVQNMEMGHDRTEKNDGGDGYYGGIFSYLQVGGTTMSKPFYLRNTLTLYFFVTILLMIYLIYIDAIPTARSLWRSHMCAVDGTPGLLECPEQCAEDTPFEECTCEVKHLPPSPLC